MQKYIHQNGEMPFSDEQVVDTFLLILMNGLKNPDPKENSK